MKISRFFLSGLVLLVIVLGLTASANAALTDNGNGTVTQTRNDGSILMWLKDANYAKTSGYDSDGRMTWYQAKAWINSLNTSNYLGYNNWRLPATLPVNGSAYNYGPDLTYDGSTDWGYNISAPGSGYPGSTGSEMAYLYYWELGNMAWCDMYGNCPQDGWEGLLNAGPFDNLQADIYWSGTAHTPYPNMVWGFSYFVGYQGDYNLNYFTVYAHAVRSVVINSNLLGDINKDGIVDILDVILEVRMALKLDPVQPCSDINNDGIVDILDVILTVRMALGLDPLKQCI